MVLLLLWMTVLSPVDEAPKNAGFLAFRTRLQEIVAKRDVKALLEVVDPNIRASFGSDHGVPAFIEMWKLNDPSTELWKELGAVLALGGTFADVSTFTAPYVFSRWPDGVDSFESVAVIGRNVRIRSAPRADAPVVATVSYEILELDFSKPDSAEWTAVKAGYISKQFVRSPIDYRATFTYSKGRWRMIFFLAGD